MADDLGRGDRAEVSAVVEPPPAGEAGEDPAGVEVPGAGGIHHLTHRAGIDHVDLLFANEAEICSLYQVATFDEALQAVRGRCAVAALTRSEKGSVVLGGGEVHVVDAAPVDRVVDTTGAGDLYAGGFLYGYTQGRSLSDCGRIGAIAAAEVISHFGARPEAPLADLVAQRMA